MNFWRFLDGYIAISEIIGDPLGKFGGFCAFIMCMMYALNSWDVLLALAFGWIPSIIVAILSYWLTRFLWLAVAGVILIILLIMVAVWLIYAVGLIN